MASYISSAFGWSKPKRDDTDPSFFKDGPTQEPAKEPSSNTAFGDEPDPSVFSDAKPPPRESAAEVEESTPLANELSDSQKKEIATRGYDFALLIKEFVHGVLSLNYKIAGKYLSVDEITRVYLEAEKELSFDRVRNEIAYNLRYDKSQNGNGKILKEILNYTGPMPDSIRQREIERNEQDLPPIWCLVRYTSRLDLMKLLWVYGAECDKLFVRKDPKTGRMVTYNDIVRPKETVSRMHTAVKVYCKHGLNFFDDKELFPDEEEIEKYKIDV
jgi:hypothetical protein